MSTWTTLADDPALSSEVADVEAAGPPFLVALTDAHRRHLTETWPHRQWLRVADGEVTAVVRTVDLTWDGTTASAPAGGVGDAISTVTSAPPAAGASRAADTLAVLDVIVHPRHRGQRLGTRVLGELDGLREAADHNRLLVLLRPHDKRRHPLVPFARYVAATDAVGRPHDGWLAAAWEAGLHPVRGVDRSLVARAPVAAWQRWYGQRFPTSGPYLLPGAIKPAIIEYEIDEGRYREPHLWVAPQEQFAQRTVDPASLRAPRDGWRRALAAAGVVPGSRRHRQRRRPGD